MTSDELVRRAEQGRRVRMARNAIPWNQSELAAAVSKVTGDPISRTIIAQIEAGKRDAEVGILKGIAATTQLSWQWLAGDKDTPGYLNPWYGTPLDRPQERVSVNRRTLKPLTAAS